MNKRICLKAGTSHGLSVQMLKKHFPGCIINCRPFVSFLIYKTATEALNVFNMGIVNLNGKVIYLKWADGSYNAEMLKGQLEREKQQAEKELLEKQKAYQGAPQPPSSQQSASAVPVGSVPLQPVTEQYVSPLQTAVGYQGNYEPAYQTLGQVMQRPVVDLWQNLEQKSASVVDPTTLVPNPATVPFSITYIPTAQFGQQPVRMPSQNVQIMSGVPGYMQPNVGQQIAPYLGPMTALNVPQMQFFGQETGQNASQRQFFGQPTGQNAPKVQFFRQQIGQNGPSGKQH